MVSLFGKKKKPHKKRVKKRIKKVKKVKPKVRKNVRTRKIKVRKTTQKHKVKKNILKKKTKAAKKPKVIFNKMPDEKAYKLLSRYRISTPAYSFCKNEKELSTALKKIGFPCVMKVSGEIIHKTEVNGVRKNINSREEAIKNFNELMKIKECEKVLVQKMIKEGYELILGGKKDPQFNRVIALGAGGIFTEFLKDVSFRIVPMSKKDAEDMLNEVKFSDIVLKGFRGQKPADHSSIVEAIMSVSRIMEKYPDIKELDINPLFATPNKALAADVRIIME